MDQQNPPILAAPENTKARHTERNLFFSLILFFTLRFRLLLSFPSSSFFAIYIRGKVIRVRDGEEEEGYKVPSRPVFFSRAAGLSGQKMVKFSSDFLAVLYKKVVHNFVLHKKFFFAFFSKKNCGRDCVLVTFSPFLLLCSQQKAVRRSGGGKEEEKSRKTMP